MTKIQATWTLIKEARNNKINAAGLKRIRQAGKALGLSEEEQIALENQLEFRNSEGKVHDYLEKK